MAKTRTTTKTATRKGTKGTKRAPAKKGGAEKAADKAAPKATVSTTASANGKTKAKKTSAIDAAAKLLGGSKTPMTTKEMIDVAAEKGLWKSPGGKTPERTLYSAILREIATKGKDARFKKAERGKFTLKG
jgi:hypothetical protein